MGLPVHPAHSHDTWPPILIWALTPLYWLSLFSLDWLFLSSVYLKKFIAKPQFKFLFFCGAYQCSSLGIDSIYLYMTLTLRFHVGFYNHEILSLKDFFYLYFHFRLFSFVCKRKFLVCVMKTNLQNSARAGNPFNYRAISPAPIGGL